MSRDAQSAKIANALKGSGEMEWPTASDLEVHKAVKDYFDPDPRRLDTTCEDCGKSDLRCLECNALIGDDEYYSMQGQCEKCLYAGFDEAASAGLEADALKAMRPALTPAAKMLVVAIAFMALIAAIGVASLFVGMR